ncbi:hypothetical protein ACFLYO_07280 [Chloroflexota bacterium]
MVLKHVLWLGGSPCSGKSSIAELLTERHKFAYYKCDDHFEAHQKRATPPDHPAFYKLNTMTWDDLWMRPVAEQLADEIAIYRESFGMILDDLREFPPEQLILAEGCALLPEFVAPLLSSPSSAIWVVPTPEFQVAHYRQRPWIQHILHECRDPAQAFQNWMDRDIGYGQTILQQAAAAGFNTIVVDGQQSISKNAALVEAHFGLSG